MKNRDGEHALSVEGVWLTLGGFNILRDVTVTLPDGRIVGIVGPNGSGKTSLLNCISGIYRPNEGRVLLGGRDITRLSPTMIAAAGVGRTFQHIELPRDLTVLEIVLLGCHTRLRHFGVAGYSVGWPYLSGHESEEREIAAAVARQMGIGAYLSANLGDLPYGVAKRADLARAVAAKPRLLLLDEPAAGLTAQEREQFAELIREIASSGVTIGLVEHDMALVAQLCSHLIVMAGGQRIGEGSVEEVLGDEALAATVLGPAKLAPA